MEVKLFLFQTEVTIQIWKNKFTGVINFALLKEKPKRFLYMTYSREPIFLAHNTRLTIPHYIFYPMLMDTEIYTNTNYKREKSLSLPDLLRVLPELQILLHLSVFRVKQGK